MVHYLDSNNELWAFDSALSNEEISSRGFRIATDDEVRAIQNPPPSADQIRQIYEGAAQSLLDSTAKSWGYDSLLSAASYVASTVAKFRAEAAALIAWRDSLWQAAYAVEVSVQGGAPMPATAADFLAELPAPPTRPTA